MEAPHNYEECQAELSSTREELKAKTEELEITLASVSLFYQVSNMLTAVSNAAVLYKILLDQISKRLGAEIGIIYKIDANEFRYEVADSLGIQERERSQIFGALSNTLLEDIYHNSTITRLYAHGDDIAVIHPTLSRYHSKASIIAPIKTKAGVSVIIQFFRCSDKEFTLDDERIVRILFDKATFVLETIAAQQQLEAQAHDAERMNKFMLGREVRMAELKKEMTQIKSEIAAKLPGEHKPKL